MTQSANARPCNCDQALKAEGKLGRVRAIVNGPHPALFEPLVLSLRAALGPDPAAETDERLLCGACLNGRHDDCSGWGCGLYKGNNHPPPMTHAEWAAYPEDIRAVLDEPPADDPGHVGQQLATISRILCDLVSAPSLDVAQFADPTLERIRLAMLGRAE